MLFRKVDEGQVHAAILAAAGLHRLGVHQRISGYLDAPSWLPAAGQGAIAVQSRDEIRSRIGEEVGVSSWITLDQARIDGFAEATEDRQFIHVDPVNAAGTMFGGTIAHGFLSLSLLSRMGAEASRRARISSKNASENGAASSA